MVVISYIDVSRTRKQQSEKEGGLQQWEQLPELNETRFASSLIVLQHRYLYCLGSAVLSRIDEEESDSEDEDLDIQETEEMRERKLQRKVNKHRDDIVKKSGKYMSKRKVKELEEKLFVKLRAKMENQMIDKKERLEARNLRRDQREKRREKMRMLRKTNSGALYFNLIERLDLENPQSWEYVNISKSDLKDYSQLGMVELSPTKILVFGGTSTDAAQSNKKNCFEVDLKNECISKTKNNILAIDKFFYGQTSVIGEKVYLLGKKHIHIYNIMKKKFKAIAGKGYEWVSAIKY